MAGNAVGIENKVGIENRHTQAHPLRRGAWIIRPMFFPFELLFSIVIIAILFALALFSYQILISKARITEAFSVATKVRTDMAVHYAFHGTWPENIHDVEGISNNMENIHIEPGGFTLTFNDKVPNAQNQQLTFRIALKKADSFAAPQRWLCGFRNAFEGEYTVSENHTTVKRKFLPFNCR